MLGAPTLQENYNHNMNKMLSILKLREEHNHMTKVCGTLTLPNTHDMIQMTTVLFHYLYNKHAQ